jgi:hypothetical protein
MTGNDDVAKDSADGTDNSEAVTRAGSLDQTNLAKRWVSYAIGVALRRFHPGIDGALGRGIFPEDVASKLRGQADDDGLMVLEEGHPDDLPQRVLDILHLIYADAEVEKIIHAATENDGPMRDSVEEYLAGRFFKEHLKRYRKRPIYWLLQSPEKNYSVLLFHECATSDTLALLQGKRYLGGNIYKCESDLQQAKQKEAEATGRERVIWSRRARDLAELLEDLRAFDKRIAAANTVQIKDRDGHHATVRWQPELDDGVLLNAAPLHELAPAWKKADSKLDLQKAWKDLADGKYDWSKTAMRYWPQQVLKACKQNTSFAIAHGLK